MRNKVIMSVLATCLAASVFVTAPVSAETKTVEYGASWSYGTTDFRTTAYSNVTSSTRYHSSSVVHGQDSDASGWVKPGTVSKASIGIAVWSSDIHYYYNIK